MIIRDSLPSIVVKMMVHMSQAAFIVGKKLRNNVIDFQPINERICALHMKTKFHNMWVINAHGPNEEKVEDIKDDFYQILEHIYNALPENDIKLIVGDFNVKIGKEEIYKGITGKHSLHTTSNDNGERLIDFAGSKNMVINSICFIHTDIHKQTLLSPDGLTANQIDHLLIDKRFASSILDVRSHCGAHCTT
jgi:exonuclease III